MPRIRCEHDLTRYQVQILEFETADGPEMSRPTHSVVFHSLRSWISVPFRPNGDRSNYKFGMIAGENRVYGQCDAEVNFKQKRFEPTPTRRGDIARAYFYMADKYNVRLSPQQQQLLQAWNHLDPVSPAEIAKNRWIKSVQGNANPFITPN